MIYRRLSSQILNSLKQFPVVGLLGARQVGKTTLAKEIAQGLKGSLYLDLERPSDRAKLADPEVFLPPYAEHLVILDEIQRMQELFPVLRSLVDETRRPGRFLVLGSASPELLKQSSETLAGRIIYHELNPVTLSELKHPSQEWRKLWLKGGYPESFLASSNEKSMRWRDAFLHTYLERDIPAFGIRVPSSVLFRFWQMLSHIHSQLWNASTIAQGLQVSIPAVSHYLAILEDTFMVRRLLPYLPNLKKRLIKSPKVYLRDSGLLHALLGIDNLEELHGHPIVGPSWEGWALEQILSNVPENWRPFFYKTSNGNEIDLVLEVPGQNQPIAIEFKFSASPQVTKGFWLALEDIKPSRAFVIAPVREPYSIQEKVRILPPENWTEEIKKMTL